jgi:hypothetical protein
MQFRNIGNVLPRIPMVLVLLSVVVLVWCLLGRQTSKGNQSQLERVARDWCQALRASQIIPVYPLTEDLAVGDVFLVQTPLADQQKAYTRNGFLALDNHVTRLPFTNYATLYSSAYWSDTNGDTRLPIPSRMDQHLRVSFSPPRAAFPEYSVQTRNEFEASARIPLDGSLLPLAAGGKNKLVCKVDLTDCRTYGGDEQELFNQIRDWAKEHRSYLAEVARTVLPDTVYLRVVTRVYLARSATIALDHDQSKSVGEHVKDKKDDIPVNEAVKGEKSGSVNDAEDAAHHPAGTSFGSSESGSVTMSKNFEGLLAVGYLGFDVSVCEHGMLGSPRPTFQQLQKRAKKPVEKELREHFESAKTQILSVGPGYALRIMGHIMDDLGDPAFVPMRERLKDAGFRPEIGKDKVHDLDSGYELSANDNAKSPKQRTDGWLFFKVEHIAGVSNLVAKLAKTNDPVSKLLLGRFESHLQKAILQAPNSVEPNCLVDQLNELVESSIKLNEKTIAAERHLRPITLAMLEHAGDDCGNERVYRNRLLLEDAYPDELITKDATERYAVKELVLRFLKVAEDYTEIRHDDTKEMEHFLQAFNYASFEYEREHQLAKDAKSRLLSVLEKGKPIPTICANALKDPEKQGVVFIVTSTFGSNGVLAFKVSIGNDGKISEAKQIESPYGQPIYTNNCSVWHLYCENALRN